MPSRQSARERKLCGTWSFVQRLTASDGDAIQYFGGDVAVLGEWIAVGARGDDVGGNDSGAVYVFHQDGGTWSEVQKLYGVGISDGSDPSDFFGYSVAFDASDPHDVPGSDIVWSLVVGARRDDAPDGAGGFEINQGGVYVFGLDAYEEIITELPEADQDYRDNFGYAVAADGDLLVVGARNDNDLIGDEGGAAYLYRLGAGGVTLDSKFDASDTLADDDFGYCVALSGTTLVVGAPLADQPGDLNVGAAYIFDLVEGIFSDGFESGDTTAWTFASP